METNLVSSKLEIAYEKMNKKHYQIRQNTKRNPYLSEDKKKQLNKELKSLEKEELILKMNYRDLYKESKKNV